MGTITIVRLVEHIRTSAGSRFSVYKDEEERRRSLISYYNEVHRDEENDGDILPDDHNLADVVSRIEEIEDIDVEEVWIDIDTDELDEKLNELADQKHQAQMMDLDEPVHVPGLIEALGPRGE